MRARRFALPALGSVVALTACQGAPPLPLPAGPQVVEVAMADFRFDYDPAIAGGRVLFRVANTGKASHSLSLLPLTDDIPPIDQQLRGTTRRAVTPLAAIKARPPGTATTVAVELVPGTRYAMVCFVDDAEGTHALRGMSSEFRTPAAPGGPPARPPSPSSTGG